MSQAQKQDCPTLQRVDLARPFLVSHLATCSKHEALYILQVNQSWVLLSSKLSTHWGGPLLGVQKANVFMALKNEIAAVTFFAKNGAALTKKHTFASVTEWIPGNTVAD